ncbi:MAG TPA: SLC13 family permease [Gemmatimonadaceae bacterium]|nr:SLC13 family permease [Gemmatimonadaceae bacterium]
MASVSATQLDPIAPVSAGRVPHALVMMLVIIIAAVGLTYVIPSGEFQRRPSGLVVAGSYHGVPKDFAAALSVKATRVAGTAVPASPVAIVSAIPAGMTQSASLIFMILFIGGMFGVLQETGALETAIERLLVVTRGNPMIVVPVVMICLAAGSSFLGLISEYLVIIPMALVLSERLGYDALFGTAIVAIAAKIGYLTSVTNPLALAVAQPIVGVPVFSGAAFRAVTFAVFLPIGIWYVLRNRTARSPSIGTLPEVIRSRESMSTPAGRRDSAPRLMAGRESGPTSFRRRDSGAGGMRAQSRSKLSGRQIAVLLVLAGTIVLMIVGVRAYKWSNPELAATYIVAAILIAVVGGVGSRESSQAFIHGMQGMMLAALLVGLAAAVELILRDAMVLDSIVAYLTRSLAGKPPVIVANMMMLMQMAIDVFIPSTSGKAAITMPILGPIGQLAGVSGQVTVQAFLFGNGLMNTLTPTSGMLLAYLATGRVSFGRWIRFVMPLAVVLILLCCAALTIEVLIGQ